MERPGNPKAGVASKEKRSTGGYGVKNLPLKRRQVLRKTPKNKPSLNIKFKKERDGRTVLDIARTKKMLKAPYVVLESDDDGLGEAVPRPRGPFSPILPKPMFPTEQRPLTTRAQATSQLELDTNASVSADEDQRYAYDEILEDLKTWPVFQHYAAAMETTPAVNSSWVYANKAFLLEAKRQLQVQCACCEGFGHTSRKCPTLKRLRSCMAPGGLSNAWLN